MIVPILMDLHVHTTYSDGKITIREAIRHARGKGLSCIAITDHFSTFLSMYKETLVDVNIDEYISDITREREEARIKCLIGIEIDMGSIRQAILTIPLERFEFILFENVNSLDVLEEVIDLTKPLDPTIVRSLAHNSLHEDYRTNVKKLCKILVRNNICFELNSSYLENRNTVSQAELLRPLVQSGVTFTIGSDAHHLDGIGNTKRSWEFVEELDAFDNVITLC